ncbi:MAG TPA: hypothetical protein VF745_12360 [Steroidobacteraceae bacterium]
MSAGPEDDGANAGGAGALLQPPIEASEAQATAPQSARNVPMTSLLRWLPGNVTLRERTRAARGSVARLMPLDAEAPPDTNDLHGNGITPPVRDLRGAEELPWMRR